MVLNARQFTLTGFADALEPGLSLRVQVEIVLVQLQVLFAFGTPLHHLLRCTDLADLGICKSSSLVIGPGRIRVIVAHCFPHLLRKGNAGFGPAICFEFIWTPTLSRSTEPEVKKSTPQASLQM